jgi:hypothetical protein
MSPSKPPSPLDIPVLNDVVVPGQRAARGQTTLADRRASDVEEPGEEEIDDSAVYNSLLGPSIENVDIEGAIDRVLDKHAQVLREELREEFERLLEEAQTKR